MNPYHIEYFQRALIQFFGAKTTALGIVRLSHGAQFSNKGSTFGFFLLLFLVLIIVVSMVQGSYLLGLFLLPFCVGIAGYVLGYQGVEIHIQQGKIRTYTSFYGLRYGDWYSIAAFNHLRICQDSILEKRVIDRGTTYASSRSFSSHIFYSLCLVHDNENHFIKLYEDENILRIRDIAKHFSELSELTLRSSIISRNPDVVGGWRVF